MGAAPADFGGTERFVVRARLGGGGMGVVYRVNDVERGLEVALKTLRKRDAASLLRFKNEFRSLTDVSHPNLVSLYELHAEGEQWFFTMELVEGADFLAHVGVPPPAPPSPWEEDDPRGTHTTRTTPLGAKGPSGPLACDLVRLRPALRQLAEGVCALHDSGHLHRDIKPSNVLVTPQGRVKLLDFGVITELTRGARERDEVVGTPAYMAPEQATRAASAASDWYSIGVVLHECLTGAVPFQGEARYVLEAKGLRAPPPPSELVSGVPGDLDELCRALLAPDPLARPSGPEVLALLGVDRPRRGVRVDATGPVLVRKHLLDALSEELAATQQGAGRVVYVHGASGMGKTSLVRQFLDEVRWLHDAVVLEGRCYERESVPFKAFDAVIDALCHHLGDLPRAEAEALIPRDVLALAQAFPVLRRVEAIAEARRRTAATRDPQEQRRRAFAALRDLLHRIAERRPLVVFIDDLHWSDLESAQLLEFVLRGPAPPPMLVVASYRTDDARRNPALAPLLEDHPAIASRRLLVEALDAQEGRTLAAQLLVRAGLGAGLADAIAREAAGSPLLIHALAQQARAHPEAAGQAVTLEQVLRARIDGLPARAQGLVEIIALAGRPLAQAVARAAAELDRSAYDEAVQALRTASLVRSTGGRDDDLVEGYHDRVRETVAAMIPPERQRARYRRLAMAIETSSSPDPDALVTYFHRAGDDATAATYAVQAARRAFEGLSFEHAAALYRAALEHGDHAPAERCALHTALGECLAAAGRGLAAAEAYAAAAALADGVAAIDLERLAAEQELRSGHIDAGRQRLAAVMARLGIRFPRGPRRAIVGLLGRRAQLRLRGLEPGTYNPSRITDRDRMRVDVCWSAATGLGPVDPPSAGVFATRNLLLALRLGDSHRMLRALALEAMFVGSAGTPARRRADQLCAAARRIADEKDDPYGRAFAISAEAFIAFESGSWAQALELTQHGLAILLDHCGGIAWEVGTMRRFALLSMIYLGRWRDLIAAAPPYLRDAEERGDLSSLTHIRALILPFLHLLDDDSDGAREETARALAGWRREGFDDQHFMAATGQVVADLYANDGPRALSHLLAIERPLAASTLRYVQVIRGHWYFYLATSCASAAAAGADDRDALLRRAARLGGKLVAEKVDWCVGYGLLARASVALVRGRDDEAAARLREGIAALERADMMMMAEAVKWRLGVLLGGDEGARMAAESARRLGEERMRNAEASSRILVVGRR